MLKALFNIHIKTTVVDYYINIMKTTFDFNLDLILLKTACIDTQKHGNKEKLSLKKASL